MHSTGESAERPLEQLAAEIRAGAVRLAAATAAWLRMVAEFDERGGWHGVGILSCAQWLSWQCGLGPGAAREHVRVARALRRLPLIERTFAAGQLSYSKVRALTRVADPSCEESLVEFAIEATASQTERLVRQWRRADRPDDETVTLKRQFDTWWDDDGMLVVRARLAPEEGALFLNGLDSVVERTARRERAADKKVGSAGEESVTTPGEDEAGPRLSREMATARRCAAMTQLAQAASALDRRAGDPPRREVVVHVDAALLEDDAAAGRSYLEGGPALHPSQVRRMMCEATVITMLERGREVLALGRKRRLASRAQRRALLRRDGGCARAGCPENRIERLHAHHLIPWRLGGRTDLSNMVLLCDNDHGLVHDLDLVTTRAGGRLIVTTANGRRVWEPGDPGFAGGLAGLDPHAPRPAENAARDRVLPAGHLSLAARTRRARRHGHKSSRTGPSISATLFPQGEPPLPESMHGNGERMNMAWAVGVLMGNRDVVRRWAAEAGVGTAA